jgi:hypothetical protein
VIDITIVGAVDHLHSGCALNCALRHTARRTARFGAVWLDYTQMKLEPEPIAF